MLHRSVGYQVLGANDVLQIEGSRKGLLHEHIEVLYCTWKSSPVF